MDSVCVDEPALVAWGQRFARALVPPVVVGLSGEVGAGKTTLVRAVAAALGVAEPVRSPTFTLVHRYAAADAVVWHVDAYRLRPEDDVRDLGFQEMLAEPRAVVLIEWPERLAGAAPRLDHALRLGFGPDPATRVIAW